jgi:hypothetical protein
VVVVNAPGFGDPATFGPFVSDPADYRGEPPISQKKVEELQGKLAQIRASLDEAEDRLFRRDAEGFQFALENASFTLADTLAGL